VTSHTCVHRAIATSTVVRFNWSTFRGNNHISANILKFSGVPGRPYKATWPQLTEETSMATNSLKATLPSLQSTKVQREPILITHHDNPKMKVKKFLLCFVRILYRCYVPLCGCLQQRHPLLQLDHFKSHGYGPGINWSKPKVNQKLAAYHLQSSLAWE